MGTSPKTGDIELGRRVVARREELRMSRRQLAEATGLSYPYVAQIETGYRQPSTKHQFILAKVLGLSLDELFGAEDLIPNKPTALTASALGRLTHATPTLDDAIAVAVEAIESLPVASRLSALSKVQLAVMQGVTEEQARRLD